jgi:hypothetical protein
VPTSLNQSNSKSISGVSKKLKKLEKNNRKNRTVSQIGFCPKKLKKPVCLKKPNQTGLCLKKFQFGYFFDKN